MSAAYSASYMFPASAVAKDGGPVPTGMGVDGNPEGRGLFGNIFGYCLWTSENPITHKKEKCSCVAKKCSNCGDYVCKKGHISYSDRMADFPNDCITGNCRRKSKETMVDSEMRASFVISLQEYNNVWWRRALRKVFPCCLRARSQKSIVITGMRA